MYDLNKLIKAFENNGVKGKDAYDAAYAYSSCELMIDSDDQDSYDKAISEEISCWDI